MRRYRVVWESENDTKIGLVVCAASVKGAKNWAKAIMKKRYVPKNLQYVLDKEPTVKLIGV